MENFFGHFNTITKHRHAVIRHCFKAGIGFQGLGHDLSKYTPTEFLVGIKYYKGTKSPNEGERIAYGYSSAWLHHKGINKHHFEYWTDYNPKTKMIEPVPMPLCYLKEMFCDRLAASKIYQGNNYNQIHPLEYYEHSNAEHLMHADTAKKLHFLLKMLAEKGEKETFKYIKNMK